MAQYREALQIEWLRNREWVEHFLGRKRAQKEILTLVVLFLMVISAACSKTMNRFVSRISVIGRGSCNISSWAYKHCPNLQLLNVLGSSTSFHYVLAKRFGPLIWNGRLGIKTSLYPHRAANPSWNAQQANIYDGLVISSTCSCLNKIR